jgi:hypothetical protein
MQLGGHSGDSTAVGPVSDAADYNLLSDSTIYSIHQPVNVCSVRKANLVQC